MDGWIKLYRKVLDNPILCKDSDYLAVWVYILLNATHKEIPALFKGERITLNPGQLITGRKSICCKFNISESKVQRILKSLENEHQIEQQTSNQNRLITVLNWTEYQDNEHQLEQQVNNERTTSEQRVNTNKNVKNVKNVKNNNIELIKSIIDYLNEKAGTKYQYQTATTQKHINARLSEDYTFENFKTVIDKKVTEWKDDKKMSQFIRPETLFGTKFESYLNQNIIKSASKPKINNFNNFPQRNYDFDELEKQLIGNNK